MIAALILILASYGIEPWQDTAHANYTESVILISQELEGTNYKLIKVPKRPNKLAYVCFKIAKQRLIQCLYLEHGTGEVYQIAVLPLKEDL